MNITRDDSREQLINDTYIRMNAMRNAFDVAENVMESFEANRYGFIAHFPVNCGEPVQDIAFGEFRSIFGFIATPIEEIKKQTLLESHNKRIVQDVLITDEVPPRVYGVNIVIEPIE